MKKKKKVVENEFTLKGDYEDDGDEMEEDFVETYPCMLKEIILKWTSNFLIMDFNVFLYCWHDETLPAIVGGRGKRIPSIVRSLWVA